MSGTPVSSVLSLKQMTLTFPKGTTEKVAAAKLDDFVRATQSMGGCGGAEAAATKLGAELVKTTMRPQGARKLTAPRIGLWDQYGGSIDAGWARWILEQFQYPFLVTTCRLTSRTR